MYSKIVFISLLLINFLASAQTVICEGTTNDESASENPKFILEIKKDNTPAFKDFGPFYKATIKYFYSTGTSYTGIDIATKVSTGIKKVSFLGTFPETRYLTFNYDDNGQVETVTMNYDKRIIEQTVACETSGQLPEPRSCSASGDNNRSLVQAIKNASDLDEIEANIACGADVNKADKNGCTPVMFVVEPYCGSHNSDPYKSVFSKPAKILDLLTNAGAFVATADKKGETPLIKAAKNNIEDIYESFIAMEADFDAQDEKGNTALIYAAKNGNVNIVEQIIEGNPNRALKNKSGKTAYDYAKASSNETIMNLVRIADTAITVQGQEDGTCSPLEIKIKEGQVLELTLAATEKMFKLDSKSLGLDLMADRNGTAKVTIAPDKKGIFKFTCGFHGAGTPSEGTITVE